MLTMSIFDHISFGVSDIARSRAFYDAALAPLGMSRLVNVTEGSSTNSAYGQDGQPRFWICQDPADKPKPSEGMHLAFLASDRAAVDAFHKAGLAIGGRDNGAPGIRAHYHAEYYAAFLIDPDGHHIEAVCHGSGEFEDQFKN
jgi:catechol 2,3-dioxygenase-like lactoylglutathione lyase family enzyme